MAKKKAAKKKAATKAKKIPKLPGNGLERFGMHTVDKKSAKAMSALAKERAKLPAFGFKPAAAAQPRDPETAARRYLEQTLESKAVPAFTRPSANNLQSEFARLGVERIPLTKTTTVKFRQTFNSIPVYGSLVTVELDNKNKLLSIHSALGTPQGVRPVAKLSPAEAIAAVKKHPGGKKDLSGAVPRVYFYYDQQRKSGKWRLVYIMEDVPVVPERKKRRTAAALVDYVVDAHTGKLVAELGRTPTATVRLRDDLGVRRAIQVERSDGVSKLINTTLNVETYDFGMLDPVTDSDQLPGTIIEDPPTFSPNAVSAHANTEDVSRFLRTALLRNNVDGNGGPMVSSINCVDETDRIANPQWFNASWNGTQVTYGQRVENDGTMLSMASALEVVAHENFHGVNDATARMIYRFETGALNESYSDIFGVIVKNWKNPDPTTWDWEFGDVLGQPRNMARPGMHGQPDHMSGYKHLALNHDHGGVHTNSGIHNKAAYNILTAEKGGALIFTPKEVAEVFYLALEKWLSRTSQFKDSRTAVVASARTSFRGLPAAQINSRIAAIEKGFSDVGIV